MNDEVSYRSDDGIAVITIERAEKMNALNEGVIKGLNAAFHRFEAADDRVAIVHASGDRAWSVGADIKDPPTDQADNDTNNHGGADDDHPAIPRAVVRNEARPRNRLEPLSLLRGLFFLLLLHPINVS